MKPTDMARKSFSKKVLNQEKVNRPSDRKLKKMRAQNRNHISKMSHFRVMGQKGDSKKGPKSQITQ